MICYLREFLLQYNYYATTKRYSAMSQLFLVFFDNQYQKILHELGDSKVLSYKKLTQLSMDCESFIKNYNAKDQNLKAAIYLTQAEINVRLALYFIASKNDKEATDYYQHAFNSCDLMEECLDDLREQQKPINEGLLRKSNTLGLIKPQNCRDKIFELISKPLGELIEEKKCYTQCYEY